MGSADTPPLVVSRREGLYCPQGDFYIDAWRPVERNVITHAHGDHARSGSAHYLTAAAGEKVLRARLGDVRIQPLEYGQSLSLRDTTITLHPAGHVLGSAQVCIRHRGEAWVVSGDYKLQSDPTCAAFESVRCHTFVTESTFGLPIYRWASPESVFAEMNTWWRDNVALGRTSVLFAYALGKAQRIIASVDPTIGPIVVHGAVAALNEAYRASGVPLPSTRHAQDGEAKAAFGQALVMAPPSAAGTPWMRRFGDWSDGFASGWMQLRGARRRRAVDRGFVLSDHADWPGLQQAIRATGAARVIVTHGQTAPMVRWLAECGLDARTFDTEFGAELDDA